MVICRSKLQRDKERDVSEKIALGMASGAPSQEALYDQRLFNQSKVSRHRGKTYLTSLPLVSVRHHGHANSVKVEIKFHPECKLRFPCADVMLRQMH